MNGLMEQITKIKPMQIHEDVADKTISLLPKTAGLVFMLTGRIPTVAAF